MPGWANSSVVTVPGWGAVAQWLQCLGGASSSVVTVPVWGQ